ncbi:MAG: lipid-binding SYLF domain-containing protein [Candidatus Omnitrophica bacterium]|nr:lipid-binding SYLF domain-containing protein [Candidatus Omnitrophota bacterium]
MKTVCGLFCALVMLLSIIAPCACADNASLNIKISEADDLIREIMQMPEQSIPSDLLSKAEGIVIFPSVLKGGFIFGARYGTGVALHRDKNTRKWSAPCFYRIAGGSWGLQIGGQIIDLVLVITNERGMKGLLQNNFTLGGDAAVSAGPVGRNAEASTDLFLKAGILSYSRSKGLFAGIALDGAVLSPIADANENYYKQSLTSYDILMANKVQPTAEGRALITTIEKYTK